MLTASRADALTEIMNMGMGHAAHALNQLIDTHITLRVPGVDLVNGSDVERRIVALGWDHRVAVQLHFDGAQKGTAALMFPWESSQKLISLMTGEPFSDPVTGESAIEEAGNILLNGVLGAFANLFEDDLTFSIPHYRESSGTMSALTASRDPEASVLLSRAHFEVSSHQIQGEILLYFEVHSIERLFAALDRQITCLQ